ncbi:MAG TPA: nitrous oxide reductase family maturation protein NosD [Planctomycetota bacterium]|nr:nitrous oxide reductase family maturation protein NosD [Planctomycetota bacterium]
MRAAAATLWLASAVAAQPATTRFVEPGGPATLRAALDASAPGDTIVVRGGVHAGGLVVDRPVKLVGEGWPRLEGGYRGDVVVVRADDVEVRGFEVAQSGRDMMVSDAGIKVRGRRARIAGNRIVDNLFGVYLRGAGGTVVEDNVIRGRAEDPLGLRGAGIHLYDSRESLIRGNRVNDVRDGVYFDHSDDNRVEGNEFFDLRYGIHYMFCKANTFTGNLFRDSMGGAAVMYTDHVVFRDNRIVNNRKGPNAFGLLFKDCLDSVAERNAIVNNTRGIFVDNSHRNVVRENLVAWNDVGVTLYASALENRFARNDFIGNLTMLLTVGRADADWSPGGEGNYYSDYAGYDLDGDGDGDVEHRLQDAFECLVGNRPLLRLFLNSAAADALAAAERSFPIVPTSDERDRAPFLHPVSGITVDAGAGRRGSPAAAVVSALALGLLGWIFARGRA